MNSLFTQRRHKKREILVCLVSVCPPKRSGWRSCARHTCKNLTITVALSFTSHVLLTSYRQDSGQVLHGTFETGFTEGSGHEIMVPVALVPLGSHFKGNHGGPGLCCVWSVCVFTVYMYTLYCICLVQVYMMCVFSIHLNVCILCLLLVYVYYMHLYAVCLNIMYVCVLLIHAYFVAICMYMCILYICVCICVHAALIWVLQQPPILSSKSDY